MQPRTTNPLPRIALEAVTVILWVATFCWMLIQIGGGL